MERLNGDVCALDPALEQRPEVFQPVGMDRTISVALGMVDNLVDVLAAQLFLRREGFRVDGSSLVDFMAGFGLAIAFITATDHADEHLRCNVLVVACERL